MSKRVLTRSVPAISPAGTAIVTDELQIRRLLTRAAEDHTPVTLKVRGTELALHGKLLDVDPKTQGIQLAFDCSPKPADNRLSRDNVEKAFLDAQSRECMVLIYLQGRSIIGVNAEPKELHDDRICFATPQKVFKIQRRKDVRFLIPQGYEFTVEFESLEQARTRVKKRLIDISESGLSFFVLSPREAAIFRVGLLLPNCVVQMQNQTVPVMMRICNHAPYDRGSNGPGNKIGVEFEQISPEDKNYLAQFVYSRAEHLFY